MSKVLYVAGPMTGIARFNFPLFDDVSAALRADGFTVISPAETDHEQTRAAAMESLDGSPMTVEGAETWGDCLARDVKMLADGVEQSGYQLLKIEGIAFLPNWEKSRGARLEAFVGLLTGKEFFTVEAHRRGPTQDIEYSLAAVTPEWVQHMLALAWAPGIAMHKPL